MKAFVFLFVCLLSCCVAQVSEYGYCRLIGNNNNPGVVGSIYLFSNGEEVTVTANISGIINPGILHGMHIHEFGDLSSPVSDSTGSHYKGHGSGIHGCPGNASRDEGDMGNWQVDDEGNMFETKTLDLLSLTSGFSVIGRAVVLHSTTDNCVAVTSAGSRLAHCVIGIGNPTYFPDDTLGETIETVNGALNPGVAAGNAAVCILSGIQGYNISGTVVFSQSEEGLVTLSAKVVGLPDATPHGFHIHQFGDLSTPDGLSLGSHYNPFNSPDHGIPPNADRHYGDMGNICAFDPQGTAYYTYTNNLLEVSTTVNNIIGRGIVVHAIRDDGSTNYGARIATCVIGIANPQYSGLLAFDHDCCGPLNCTAPLALDHGYNTTIPTSTSSTTGAFATSSLSGSSSTSGSTGGSDVKPAGSNTGVIVASILIPLVVINVIIAAVYFYIKNKKKTEKDERFTAFLEENDNS